MTFLVCVYPYLDFAQNQQNLAQLPDCMTATFRISVSVFLKTAKCRQTPKNSKLLGPQAVWYDGPEESLFLKTT